MKIKLSDIITYKSNKLDNGRLPLRCTDVATDEPWCLGSRAAELIARTVGCIHGHLSVRFSGTAFTGHQHSYGHATLAFVDNMWHVTDANGTWRKYAPSSTTDLFGSSGTNVTWSVDDVDVSDDVAASIRSAMAADDAARAEAVVWRPRDGQIVVRVCHAGDSQGSSVLLPDGRELQLSSSAAARQLLAEELGVGFGEAIERALETDAVVGRSGYEDRGMSSILTRVMPERWLVRLCELETEDRARWADDPTMWRNQQSVAYAAVRGVDLLGWGLDRIPDAGIRRDYERMYPAA